MSLHYVIWAFDQDLPCSQKFVLVALGDSANHEGTCWPSQATLAQKCGLSRSAVNTILGDLEEGGYLTIGSRQRAKGGGDTSCVYTLRAPLENLGRVLPPPTPGFLYIAARDDSIIKVGITTRLDARVRALASSSGSDVTLVKAYPLPMDQARRFEREIKESLSHGRSCRLSGEWFRLAAEEVLRVADAIVQAQPALDLAVSSDATPAVSSGKTPGVVQDDRGCRPARHPSMNLPKEPSKEPKDSSAMVRHVPNGHAKDPDETLEASFAGFYAAFPLHKGRGAAWTAYQRARKKTDGATLHQGALAYADLIGRRKATERDFHPRFILHPATWLNQERWADEPAPGEGEAPRKRSGTMAALERLAASRRAAE